MNKNFLLSFMLVLPALGHAAGVVPGFPSLYDNGDGAITHTRTDGSSLMWLQDATQAGTDGYVAYAEDAGRDWDELE